MAINTFVVFSSAVSIIVLGLWTGLVFSFVIAVLSVYIGYKVFLIKEGELDH